MFYVAATGPAETCEPALPKALFLDQPRPNGWVFPSCKPCNGLSRHDQLAAYITYSQAPEALTQANPLTNSQRKLIDGFVNNSPFPYKQAQSVPVYDKSAQIWTTTRRVGFTEEAAKKLALRSAKQSLAMWYEQTIHNFRPSSSLSTAKNIVGGNVRAVSRQVCICEHCDRHAYS